MFVFFSFVCSSTNAFATNARICLVFHISTCISSCEQVIVRKVFSSAFKALRLDYPFKDMNIICTILCNFVQIISTLVFSIYIIFLGPTENQITNIHIHHITLHFILILSNGKTYCASLFTFISLIALIHPIL